jgi:hypothetical protein
MLETILITVPLIGYVFTPTISPFHKSIVIRIQKFLNLDISNLMEVGAKQLNALNVVGTIKLFVDGMGTLKKKGRLINGTKALMES